jgi:dethiobiotin synthetase
MIKVVVVVEWSMCFIFATPDECIYIFNHYHFILSNHLPTLSMKAKSLFVAATGQHVGKTTSCLGLLTGLRKYFPLETVNYMKPVGQQYVELEGVKVDKDVVLFKKWFDINAAPSHLSPVVIPQGYTRDYIDGKHNRQNQLDNIVNAHTVMSAGCKMMVIEGTGHTGVGSVIEVNNAQVAKLLGAKVVLIGKGGLGSSFDELELNRTMFEHHGVEIAGVVLNKCNPAKIPMLKDYFSRLLVDRWGDVPLLGLVPDNRFLTQSTLADLKKHLKAELLAGDEYGHVHYDNQSVMMVSWIVLPL